MQTQQTAASTVVAAQPAPPLPAADNVVLGNPSRKRLGRSALSIGAGGNAGNSLVSKETKGEALTKRLGI